jgi:transcriptional regulator with XRE-family HTH domain
MSGQVATMAAPNRLAEIRNTEGLSQSELAKLANLNSRTISRVESGRRNVAPTTKGKIIKGLNKYQDKLREYTLDYVFPQDAKRAKRKASS